MINVPCLGYRSDSGANRGGGGRRVVKKKFGEQSTLTGVEKPPGNERSSFWSRSPSREAEEAETEEYTHAAGVD